MAKIVKLSAWGLTQVFAAARQRQKFVDPRIPERGVVLDEDGPWTDRDYEASADLAKACRKAGVVAAREIVAKEIARFKPEGKPELSDDTDETAEIIEGDVFVGNGFNVRLQDETVKWVLPRLERQQPGWIFAEARKRLLASVKVPSDE